MGMCRGSVQRPVKSFMLQPEYPLTWTCFGASVQRQVKSFMFQPEYPPYHGHVSGLCTKVSQKLHALARISSYMDMFRGFVQRQVKSFMFQPEYHLNGHVSGLCTKVSQKLHALARISPYMDMLSRKSKASCTKASQKIHALARISPYMDMFRGMLQPQYTKVSQSQKLHALARISPYMDMCRLYKGKSKASCSSQNIPLHGHVSGLCTKASQKLHALARISPYMDMCRGSVQRQIKSFMFQPEYPLTWTCVGALYKGKSKASCSSQNIPFH